eukprot:5523137-Pyramimonas_sp.AAC.1
MQIFRIFREYCISGYISRYISRNTVPGISGKTVSGSNHSSPQSSVCVLSRSRLIPKILGLVLGIQMYAGTSGTTLG